MKSAYKKVIAVCFILAILCLSFTGCKAQDKNIKTIVSDYYIKTYGDRNNGELKVFAELIDGENTFILAEKYMGEGEISIDLFVLDKQLVITQKTSVSRANSPCYSIGTAVLGEKRIVFGDYKSKKYDYLTDKIVDVIPKGIELKFADDFTVITDFSYDEVYLVIANTTSKIVEANVYEEDGKIVSTLPDTYVSESEFQDVIGY